MDKIEAEELMQGLITLRSKAQASQKKEDVDRYTVQERKCIEGFKYIVLMRANRYKNFFNYEDLVQEGLEALAQAMKTYNPTKGIFFYWAHKYIDTRIARRASLHTAIRFPLQFTKKFQPYRESFLPALIDTSPNPEEKLEKKEIWNAIGTSFSKLTPRNRKIANMYFGVDNGKPQTLTKVCKKFNISKPMCESILNQVVSTIKQEIKA